MSSGEDIEAGRVTTAESTTVLLGALPSERDVNFNGVVILRVAPQPGDLDPKTTIDGIHGIASSHVDGFNTEAGGTGVVGFGGPIAGTGVIGLGGGETGRGGVGVQATGGSVPDFPNNIPPGTGVPGAGVVAQGGRVGDDANFPRISHGAGVIALAGGSSKPIPPFADTGSVGLYAQGAESQERRVDIDIDNIHTVSGPTAPGPGVLGRGGVPFPRRGPVAAGVIGLAGDGAIPDISETGDTGVYGAGPTGVFGHGAVGVRGQGTGGPGVHGAADADRGGVFESGRSAQLQLVPQAVRGRMPGSVAATPTALPPGSAPALPKDGRGGDLMVVEMETEEAQRGCTLWFCVQGAGAGAARWAQVLVGTPFDGQA